MKAKIISCTTVIALFIFTWIWAMYKVPCFNEPVVNFARLAGLGMCLITTSSFIGVFTLTYLTVKWILK